MFQINLRSQRSIYEQIIDNIKELIVKGVLAEDSELPSIRELSRSLTVNPNTVQKAFKELEREGFIYKVVGKGTFVSPRQEEKVDPKAVRKICEGLRAGVQELCYLGVPEEDIQRMVAEIAADPFPAGSAERDAGAAKKDAIPAEKDAGAAAQTATAAKSDDTEDAAVKKIDAKTDMTTE